MMDLCFLINQFITPLPESLQEFKDILKEHLPYICDTKLMANTTPFKEDIPETSLEELLRTLLQGKPFQMPQVETGKLKNTGQFKIENATKYILNIHISPNLLCFTDYC